MRRLACSFVAATALFALAAATGEAVAHPPIFTDADSEQRAEELRRKGNALSREGMLAEAVEAYTASFRISETYAIAANLGTVELKLERYRDAAEHLAFAIRATPPDAKPIVTEALKRALADAKKHVATLTIHVTVDRTDVTIDEVPVDGLVLGSEVYVDPGAHTVSAKRAGYANDQKSVDARAGALVEVELAPAPPPMSSSSAVAAPLASVRSGDGNSMQRDPRRVTAGAVLGGVAGVTLAPGIGLFAVAAHQRSTAQSLNHAITQAHQNCVIGAPSYDPLCPDLASSARAADVLNRAGLGLVVGAGAAGLGALASVFWPVSGPKSTARSTVRITPIVSTMGASVFFSGTL